MGHRPIEREKKYEKQAIKEAKNAVKGGVAVYAYDGKIVIYPDPEIIKGTKFFVPVTKDGSRFGSVLMDTKTRLRVSKEAIELMKKIERNHDAIGDISWWHYDGPDGNGYAFSWFGALFRVIDPETAEGDRDFRITDDLPYTEIPNDVPPEIVKGFTNQPKDSNGAWWRGPYAELEKTRE